jgi:hypothetical protein
MPHRPALVLPLLSLGLLLGTGCGGGSGAGEAATSDQCQGLGALTIVRDGNGDVTANVNAPTPPPPPRGLDLVQVRVARSPGKLCAVFDLEAAPPAPAGFRIDLRETGKADSGALVGITAMVNGGQRYVQLGYPGADERSDRGLINADIGVRANQVSLVMDTATLPDWTPPVTDFEWQASTLGFGDRPGLQYGDCAPERTQHVAYPSGRLVQLPNGGGSC